MPSNFHVVLVEPDIAENTGSIARLCVATDSELHLVGRLGFHLDDRRIRRAGLDYWQYVKLHRHVDFPSCWATLPAAPVFFFSARAQRRYTDARFTPGSLLVFGNEGRGLPPSLLADADCCFRIPIVDDRVRSINVACAVSAVLFEAIRQNGCSGF